MPDVLDRERHLPDVLYRPYHLRVGSMGKRRGRRTRSDERGGRVNLEDAPPLGWPTGHSRFTPMGQIEAWRDFARGMKRQQGRRRVAAFAAISPWLLVVAVWIAGVVAILAVALTR